MMPLGLSGCPVLSLLTSHHVPQGAIVYDSQRHQCGDGSCCSHGSAIDGAYPALWPESIRGLIVHSAEWPDAMRRLFLPARPSKADYASLVRHCGFGVPDLERALWSISNSLTMVEESQLNPFQREGKKQPTLRDMNLHRLPWPLAELEALGETPVEMRVTLSYFIEPNPSARDFRSTIPL